MESEAKRSGFMESFKRKLEEVRKLIDEDRHRKRVLMICQQHEPRSFEEYSSSGSFRKLEKFESSTYSEVLKAINLADNNRPVVMKIMRALSRGVLKRLPSAATRGCQSFSDILNELVVTQALSKLHDGVILTGRPTGNGLYQTHFFCLILEIKVVNGNFEKTLSKSRSQNKSKLPTANVDEADDQDQANKLDLKDDELRELNEDDRMLMEALPHEYVVTVMKHDGQPLWWMMTHKKLNPEQLTSILVQVIVGLAIAESVYYYEHRDLHVSNILTKKTSKSIIPFILEGNVYHITSHGIKATIIDATFSRLTHNGKVYFRDLSSTLRAYGSNKTPPRMSLQNRSYRQMVHMTKNKWEHFAPKTNLIWLTYLCETLMKNDILKSNASLLSEVKKIRDYTLKVSNTMELLNYFPFEKRQNVTKAANQTAGATGQVAKSARSTSVKTDGSIGKLTKLVTKDLKSYFKQAVNLRPQPATQPRESDQSKFSSQNSSYASQASDISKASTLSRDSNLAESDNSRTSRESREKRARQTSKTAHKVRGNK